MRYQNFQTEPVPKNVGFTPRKNSYSEADAELLGDGRATVSRNRFNGLSFFPMKSKPLKRLQVSQYVSSPG
jgi:hypothetical protein